VPDKTSKTKPIVCLVTGQELVDRSWVLQDAEILTSMGLRVTYATIRSPLPTPSALRALAGQLKCIVKSDIVFGWFAYPTTLFIGKVFGKPTVLNAVGYEVALYPDFGYGLPSSWYPRALVRIALRSADYVIAISRESARWARTWGAKHVVVIYEGISTSKFKPTARRSSHKRQIVLTTAYLSGTNVIRKDFATLLLAMKRVLDALPDVKMVIVGEKMDGYPLLVKTAHELGISYAITFRGYIHLNQYRKILREASVFVMPSLHEGFPTVLCEALLCEVPIVTTDRATMNEVFTNGEEALLVEAGNPERLAGAIITVLNNKDLAGKMAHNGRKLVERNYSTEVRAKKLRQLFQTVLADELKSNRRPIGRRMIWLVTFISLSLLTPLAMIIHRLLRTCVRGISVTRQMKQLNSRRG
jgi:glycosyltransferase involved in cell wall biosynthesis